MNRSLELESLRKNWRLLALAGLAVAVADQASKYLIVNWLREGEIRSIIPGLFNLTLTYNQGAAFGILSGWPDIPRMILLAITTTAAIAAVVYFLLFDYSRDLTAQTALVMIIGGAAGNVIDRLRLGVVVDFFDVYLKSYHWPAFNIADSAICIGVAVLVFRHPCRSTAGKD